MNKDTYKPDGKCGTCRHLRHMQDGDGWNEPLSYDEECGVEDQLVQIRDVRQQVADDCGDEDAYGADPIEGCGDTKPCPLYLEYSVCKTHGLREHPQADFGCPTCTEEAEDALAQDMEDEARLAAEWRREQGL